MRENGIILPVVLLRPGKVDLRREEGRAKETRIHRERMVTNLDVTDFQLDDADMRAIAALDEGQGVVNHYDPAFQERLASFITVEED